MADENTPTEEQTPEPTILDAITTALEPILPKVEEPVAAPDDAEVPDEELEADDDESEDDEGADGADRARGPDGKFLPKGDKTPVKDEPKLGADGKPIAKVDEKAAVKKDADPVNDPIPEELKGRTRERITSLVGLVKDKDALIEQQNQVFDTIKNTGATPEEFGAMIAYMRWTHTDDPAQLTQARDMLQRELRAVSLKLGTPTAGVDFLADHPELMTAVNNGQITMEHAQELAIQRTRVKQTADAAAARTSEASTTQAATAERNGAIAELNTLGKELSKSDPHYDHKYQQLKPLLESLGMLPPKQWKAAFQRAYAQIPAPTVAAVTPPAPKPGDRPLRANKSPSGGSAAKPSNMMEAMFGDGFPGG